MIDEQTFLQTNEFAASATKIEPDADKRDEGMGENEGVPFEYLNYFWNLLTKNSELFRGSLESLIAEIKSVLTDQGLSPDSGTVNQLLSALNTKINTAIENHDSQHDDRYYQQSEVDSLINNHDSQHDDRFAQLAASLNTFTGSTYFQGGEVIGFRDSSGNENTITIKRKIIEIGDWNMDEDDSCQIDLGVGYGSIRSVNVLIRNDFNNVKWDFFGGGYYYLNQNGITLFRNASGYFDGTVFDSTSYNRGWVLIEYTA